MLLRKQKIKVPWDSYDSLSLSLALALSGSQLAAGSFADVITYGRSQATRKNALWSVIAFLTAMLLSALATTLLAHFRLLYHPILGIHGLKA